ncbi:Uncharacterized protein MLTONO_1872 [Mesorhizobium loti]|nr:Uncharacterized protein MLTONO_1872 [Mesorhizobium loti]
MAKAVSKPQIPVWLKHRGKDPYPDIRPALLSREHIKIYAETTDMIEEFEEKRLKAASYEMKIGRQVWRWEPNSPEPISVTLKEGDLLYLQPNSITFVQLSSELRLPLYIAMRFNLKIRFVHSGILLGTGPLVDPGYRGNLLIPLHNLTDTECVMDLDEGLIWAEFTKTTYDESSDTEIFGTQEPIDPAKLSKPPTWWFKHANGGKPVRSSIPMAVRTAEQSAKIAANQVSFLTSVGVVAIILGLGGIFAVLQGVNSNIADSNAVARSARSSIDDFRKEIAESNTQQISRSTAPLSSSLADAIDKIKGLQKEVSDLNAKIETLESQKKAP